MRKSAILMTLGLGSFVVLTLFQNCAAFRSESHLLDSKPVASSLDTEQPQPVDPTVPVIDQPTDIVDAPAGPVDPVVPDQARPGQLSIVEFGAKGDGTTDNTAALKKAFDQAQAKNLDVFVPKGVFVHKGILAIKDIQIVGAGRESELRATDPTQSSLTLQGSGVGLAHLLLTSPNATKRMSNERHANRVRIMGAKNFLIDNVFIENSGATGIYIDNGHNGIIRNSTVRNTKADSIHIVAQSSDLQIENNKIEFSGDDGIAVVSYRKHGGVIRNITARGNKVLNNKWGRNMTVVGGENVLYENNYLDGNEAHGACMYFVQEESYQTYGAKKVTARNNTLKNCGGPMKGHGALTVYGAGQAYIVQDIIFENNRVQPRQIALFVNGNNIDDILMRNNEIALPANGKLLVTLKSPKNVKELSNTVYSGLLKAK